LPRRPREGRVYLRYVLKLESIGSPRGRGERASALLSVPVFAALNSYFDSQLGVTGVLGIFFFFGGLTFVGLLLTIRAFFLRR
jgi:hypothetical protein